MNRSDLQKLTKLRLGDDWKEDVRYSLEITKDQAEALYSAVVSRRDGILPWLQSWW